MYFINVNILGPQCAHSTNDLVSYIGLHSHHCHHLCSFPKPSVSLGWAYYDRYEAKPEIPEGQGMSVSVSQSETSWSTSYLRGLEDSFRLCERWTHVRNLTVNSIVYYIYINIQVKYTIPKYVSTIP
jgi:hypothetical protein